MCSIAGVIGGDMSMEDRFAIGESMNKALKHRGPDDSGVYSDDWLCLAHNRLAVIDPANGAQPMAREAGNGKFVLVYNGELYNTPELRRELEKHGHAFRTDCDTEVLLAAYIEWGRNCLERLNGIFAFAVYDTARRKVFLARDRLGTLLSSSSAVILTWPGLDDSPPISIISAPSLSICFACSTALSTET
jgi:asparagine synthase (glutamine-hydrolysing)